MIQRIQSIFLLLGSGACFSLFGLPVADTETVQPESALFADQKFTLLDNPILMILIGLAGLLLLGGIFLYKNRKLQSTLSKLSIAMITGGIGLGFYLLSTDTAQEVATFASGTVFPVIAIVLAYLANFYINKDEKLVRSADRLR
jgi:LPXTG-motif cell wall-anchored protein